MCCFSRPVNLVTNTNIFARASEKGRQFLVYSMTLQAKEDLAMILPLPVPAKSPEDAVRFINLKDYPDFFDHLKAGFPQPPAGRSWGMDGKDDGKKPLAVVDVGEFEASFVPTVKDFERLDARFRLPDNAWEKLPKYKDHGFAVFKLKPGAKKIHPMAFEFPRADATKLFFPTVHIHDGEVHEKAAFDHALYLQTAEDDRKDLTTWAESPLTAAQFMKMDKALGLLDGPRHLHRLIIKGQRANEDILL